MPKEQIDYSKVLDYKGNEISLIEDKLHLFLFVSLFCNHCVEFLPEINTIKNKIPEIQLILFCNGDEEEHSELSKYFRWDFPIVYMQPEDATLIYDVEKFPYMILIKENKKMLGASLTEWEVYENQIIRSVN